MQWRARGGGCLQCRFDCFHSPKRTRFTFSLRCLRAWIRCRLVHSTETKLDTGSFQHQQLSAKLRNSCNDATRLDLLFLVPSAPAHFSMLVSYSYENAAILSHCQARRNSCQGSAKTLRSLRSPDSHDRCRSRQRERLEALGVLHWSDDASPVARSKVCLFMVFFVYKNGEVPVNHFCSNCGFWLAGVFVVCYHSLAVVFVVRRAGGKQFWLW